MYDILKVMDRDFKKHVTSSLLQDSIIAANFDNVAEYWTSQPDHQEWSLNAGNFPRCLPPWPVSWIEWSDPSSGGITLTSKNRDGEIREPARWGVLVIRKKVNPHPGASDSTASIFFDRLVKGRVDEELELLSHVVTEEQKILMPFDGWKIYHAFNAGARFLPDAEWTVAIRTYWKWNKHTFLFPGYMGAQFLALDRHGDFLKTPALPGALFYPARGDEMHPEMLIDRLSPERLDAMKGDLHALKNRIAYIDEQKRRLNAAITDLESDDRLQVADFCIKIMKCAGAIAMLGFSLANCSNVKQESTPLPRGQRRRMEREKNELGKVTFKTLKISPMTKRGKREAASRVEEGGSRLHICRGHFKDYRHGPGLFGKHKGLFWWESHLRGDADLGRVHKDYEEVVT